MTTDTNPTATTVWAGAKGGVGTTSATLIAASVAHHRGESDVLVVDLCGDVGVVLGDELDKAPGITEVLAGKFRPAEIDRLVVDMPGFGYLPRGQGSLEAGNGLCWHDLWRQIGGYASQVMVDGGRIDTLPGRLRHVDARTVLVTSRCYQAYCRTIDAMDVHDIDALVVVEDGTASSADFAAAFGRDPAAVLDYRPEIAKWTNEGTLFEEGHRVGTALATVIGIEIGIEIGPMLRPVDADSGAPDSVIEI